MGIFPQLTVRGISGIAYTKTQETSKKKTGNLDKKKLSDLYKNERTNVYKNKPRGLDLVKSFLSLNIDQSIED